MTLPQTLCESRCPLCGSPNACTMAATGCPDTACWCREVTFSQQLLAQVPETSRGKACICRSCAEGGLRETVDRPESTNPD